MPPKPTVDPDLIRQILSEEPRPSAAETARILSELLGQPVSQALVTATIRRHRHVWDLAPPPTGGGSAPAMIYQHELALMPALARMNALRRQLRQWERLHRHGTPDPKTVYEERVLIWGNNLLAEGRVVDCVQEVWSVRLAWPWDLGHLWTQPRPRVDAMAERLRIPASPIRVQGPYAEVTVHLTKDHERKWKRELDRLARA